MRLGFHYHIPAILNSNQILMPGYQGRFVDSLAAYCDQVVCFLHSPSHQEVFQCDYRIRSNSVTLVDIGPHTSVPHRTFFSNRFAKPVNKWEDKLDVLLIRGPSPLLPALAKNAASLPIVLLLVSDYRVKFSDISQPFWRKVPIQLWATWNYKQQLEVSKNSLTFVNSHKLHQDLKSHVPNLIETRTTTLSSEDFFEREDTCLSPPHHLLYTGRMTRVKGLLELVEAVSLLIKEGQDVVLDLVGQTEKNDSILEEIGALANSLGINDRIIYHGYKPFGPALFSYYQRSDVYVIPSYYEGFPRAIWEAMAFSLPVVATRVGSIPAYISDVARLVPPKNITALANAISDLLSNPDLRQSLIQKGRALAQSNTLNQRTEEMVLQIEQWINTCRLEQSNRRS